MQKINKENILKAFKDVLKTIKENSKDSGVLSCFDAESLEGLTLDQALQSLNRKIAPKLFINTNEYSFKNSLLEQLLKLDYLMFAKVNENGFYLETLQQYKKAPSITELDNIFAKPFYWFISSKLGFKYQKEDNEDYGVSVGLLFGKMPTDADFFIYTGYDAGLHSYEDGGFHYITEESIYGMLEGLQELEEKKDLKLRVSVQELWDVFHSVFRNKTDNKIKLA